MNRTIILLAAITISAYSCKKEVTSSYSEANQTALQGNWVQDSSWTFDVNTEVNPNDTTIVSTNYASQNFTVEGDTWTNVSSNWSQNLDIFDDFIEIGGTRYSIDKLTTNRFVLTRVPQGAFTTHYTRWFSR